MINISSNIYEKQQICKYLITYQHLCDESALESTDRIVEYINEIAVEGIKYPLYIATENLELLQASKNDSIKSNYARILAPLDNILWNRKLIAELFDFNTNGKYIFLLQSESTVIMFYPFFVIISLLAGLKWKQTRKAKH